MWVQSLDWKDPLEEGMTTHPSILAWRSEVAQSCLTLCDPMDCSPPGSSVRGIVQARVLEWVAISFSRDLPLPGINAGSPTLLADTFTV